MTLATLSPEELAARARAEAERIVHALTDAPIIVDPGAAESAWQPALLRQIHRQAITLRRRFDEVTVVMGSRGFPLRFEAKNRTLAPLGGASLDPREALAIAGTSGLLGDDAEVTSLSTPGLTEVLVTQARAPSRVRFLLHPDLRLIAAFEVLDEGPRAP
ncbi:MAG: hypothetical protein U0359_06565 [Byssovorax sp.]